MRYTFFSILLVGLPASLFASDTSLPGSSYVLETGVVPVEPYGMTGVADLDGDGFEDVGVLVGDELMVLFSPALYEVLVPGVLGGQNDLVGVAADRPNGRDTIAVVGDQGAGLLGWNGSEFTFRVIGPGWVDALRVDVVPRVGAQPRQLIGVMADGLTVRRLTEDLGDPQAPWSDTLVCTRMNPITELTLANLDGAAEPEIGLMGSSGVEIRNWLGSTLSNYEFAGGALALNRVRDSASNDWFAMLGSQMAPLGAPFIATLGHGGFVRSDPFDGDPMFVGMAAGDLDPGLDGMDDLVLSYRDAHAAVYLENTGVDPTGPIFQSTTEGSLRFVPLGPAGPASLNQTTPAVADFDNDGDADIVHPVQQNGSFFVFMSAGIDQEGMKPRIDTRFPSRFVLGSTIEMETVLMVDAGVLSPTGNQPSVLEVLLYRRPDVDSPMDIVPTYSARLPVVEAVPGDAGELLFPLEIPLIEPALRCTYFDAMYFLVARLAVESQGVIIERCPTRLIGIQGQASGENSDFLEDHSSKPDKRVFFEHQCFEVVPGGAGAQSGISPQVIILSQELGGSGDELDCLPMPTAGNKPPILDQ